MNNSLPFLERWMPRPTLITKLKWAGLVMLALAILIAVYSLGMNQTWYEHDQIENHCVEGRTDWQVGHDLWGRPKVEWYCFQRNTQ